MPTEVARQKLDKEQLSSAEFDDLERKMYRMFVLQSVKQLWTIESKLFQKEVSKCICALNFRTTIHE